MQITREQVESLWYTPKKNAELQKELGVSVYGLWMLKKKFGLPHRPCGTPYTDDPDEKTIAALCLAAQAKWTPAERERRRVGGAGGVTMRKFRLAAH